MRSETLRDAEENFVRAFNYAPLYLTITSLATGTFVMVNDTFVELSGYRREEIIGKSSLDKLFVDARDPRGGTEQLEQQGFSDQREVRLHTANGETRTVLVSSEIIEFGGERCVLSAAVDITKRKAAEAALERSELRFRGTFENAAVGIAHVGMDGAWLRVNERLCEFVGYSKKELLKKTFQDITHPDDIAPDLEKFGPLMRGEIDSYDMDKRYFHKDGSLIWVHLTTALQRDETGKPLYCISVVEDISKRKAAEAALVELNRELESRVLARTRQVRELAGQLTLAEARERGRLAQVLHDGLQQQLYGMQFSLREVEQAAGGNTEVLVALETTALLKEALNIARTTTTTLSPPVLKGQGLTEALKWLGGDMEKRHGLSVTVNAREALTVPSEPVRVLLFNLVRELLFNVVKHAEVSTAAVELREDVTSLSVTVSDKGNGFDVALLDNFHGGTGLGLSGIDQRLSLFGGRLTVASTREQGTRVAVHMPVTALSLD